jgi:hypothetical protein
MKRLNLILLVFLSGIVPCLAAERPSDRFTYGIEWACIGVFYSGYHYNFFAPEGYRVDPRGYSFRYDTNGEAFFHVGYNITDKVNLALYFGVSAFEDHHATLPLSLRVTGFFKDNPLQDRWFWFIDAGTGLSIKEHPEEIYNGKLGCGYRLSLSRKTKLDIHLSLRSSYTHPEIYYYDIKIDAGRINRNNAYLSAVAFGMSLTF